MAVPFLKTKLYIPPVRPDMVARPHLIVKLEEGLRPGNKLILLSAPAGFGKTTTLAAWINHARQNSQARFGWLSLDREDNTPVHFWIYFVRALQVVLPELDAAILGMLEASEPAPLENTLTLLLNAIAAYSQPLVLILDDYHLLEAPAIHASLTFFLEHQPPHFHLALATRIDPPWPLARLRVRKEITELRAGDLRFTPEEAATFLNDVMSLNLSGESVSLLDARTEGWIAGLQMAALAMQAPMSMQGRGDAVAFVQAFSGSHRFILDYLVEEVLDRQPGEIQAFLLKTSILDRLTASLCDAVTGREDSQALLTQLERANLFLVPLDDDRHWYRYHHLFADLLRGRLKQNWPEQLPVLHRRASEWYEQSGLLSEALSHAAEVGDTERLIRLIVDNALSLVYQGELATVLRWLEALPAEERRSRPWLCMANAWVLVFAGHVEGARQSLQDAERALQADAQPITGHVAAVRAYIAALEGDTARTVVFARQALDHLTEEDLAVRGYATMMLGAALRDIGDFEAASQYMAKALSLNQASGNYHLILDTLWEQTALLRYQGRLREMWDVCQRTLQLADEYNRQGGWHLQMTGYIYLRQSYIAREWNDLESALRFAKKSIELCTRWGEADVMALSAIALAKALWALGNLPGALDVIQEARRAARDRSPWHYGLLAAWEARVQLAQGDVVAASAWLRECGLGFDDTLRFEQIDRYFAMAHVLVAQDRYDEAARLLARLLEFAETSGATGYVIEILTLQALTWQRRGDVSQALPALERALTLAEPEGDVRMFIDHGEPMARLLRNASAQGIMPGYTSKLLEVFDRQAPRPERSLSGHTEPLLTGPFTERELEVLSLLRTSLSLPEIADRLYVSVNTVRSHVKHIYDKLDVHGRTEAIDRAEDLGLF